MRRALFTALVAGVVLIAPASLTGAAGAGGVTGPSFYVDETLYRTVGTPTDLSGTGAPVSSFDTIYEFFGAQPFNVATAADDREAVDAGEHEVEDDEVRLGRFDDRSCPAAVLGLERLGSARPAGCP